MSYSDSSTKTVAFTALETIDDYGLAVTPFTAITLPSTLTSIGDVAFGYCASLTALTIPGSVSTFGNYLLQGSAVETLTIGDGISDISQWAFNSSGSLTELVLQGTTAISLSNSSFNNCTNLDTLTIASGKDVTLGNYAFDGAAFTSLDFVTMDVDILTVGESAFNNCTSLTSVIFQGLTDFGRTPFSGCTSLELIDFPSTLATIYPVQTLNSTNVVINCRKTIPPVFTEDNPFGSGTVSAIHVPIGSQGIYDSATGWSSYMAIITGDL